MPKASKQSASESETVEGYEGHFEHFDGGYSVAFETYTQDADLAPFFKGLPGDRCQAAHWGYVLKGKVAYHFDDRTVTAPLSSHAIGQATYRRGEARDAD